MFFFKNSFILLFVVALLEISQLIMCLCIWTVKGKLKNIQLGP